MKTIRTSQFAIVKRVAQNVQSLVARKNKIAKNLEELTAEYEALKEEIEGHEFGVKRLTGGYTSEDLVIKKVYPTDKVDKNGNTIKVTKYEINPEKVKFDADKNLYYIKEAADLEAADLEAADLEAEHIKSYTPSQPTPEPCYCDESHEAYHCDACGFGGEINSDLSL